MFKISDVLGRLGFAFAMVELRRDADVAGGGDSSSHFLGKFANPVLVLADDDRREGSRTIRLTDVKSHWVIIDGDFFP
jgi:hypothetical protein